MFCDKLLTKKYTFGEGDINMSITSLIFLLVFLPVSLGIYYVANDRAKEYILLGISIVFYALGSIQYVVLFSLATFLIVLIGRAINTCQGNVKTILLITGIIINVGLLIYYKYTDFAITSWGNITSTEAEIKGLILPLGISFFTFKAISYLVDIFKGIAILDNRPIHDALYLSFFSQIQSGPLTRYNDMQINKDYVFDQNLFANGTYRFLIGFSKKILIANVLSNITSEVFSAPFENFSTSYAWLGSICYSLQLFFDFAGYSDMAIGISEMFGYKCMENFNYPYMTESVTKFWRRWHISLSEWFRDYIYIPLGGSRVGKQLRIYFNLFVVWILTGIWHGAAWHFVTWGLGYFIVIAFERLTNFPGRFKFAPAKFIYRILSLLFVNFQWVIFNSSDLRFGLRFIKRMLIYTPNHVADIRTLFLLKDYSFFIGLAIILCFPLVPVLSKKIENNKLLSNIFEIMIAIIVLFAFVWSLSFIVAGQNNPFAYANF